MRKLNNLRTTIVLIAFTMASVDSSRSHAAEATNDFFASQIRPILEKNCYECHGPEKRKGDPDLTLFPDLEKIKEAPEVWQAALERVQAYEMPPAKAEATQLRHARQARALDARTPKPEKADCNQIASDRNANFYKGLRDEPPAQSRRIQQHGARSFRRRFARAGFAPGGWRRR
jgi:mono/diheme cytochrome c family protein